MATLEAPPRTLTALELLQAECTRVDELQVEMRTRIEEILSSLGGQDFPSIEAKKEVVAKINRLLKASESKIECPHCGGGAMLRCAAIGTAKNGAFQFEHTNPRTAHGGKVRFPHDLRLLSE